MTCKNILKIKYFILCLLIEGFSVSAYALKCENEFNVSLHVSRWMSFEEAKALMQEIGITSRRLFLQWSKSGQRPKNFPSNPNITYKDEWKGWGDFLGTGSVLHETKEWMSFGEAKALMQEMGITSFTQFLQWSRSGQRPENFPSDPRRVYKDEWKGWGDFLSTGIISARKEEGMSFEELQDFLQSPENVLEDSNRTHFVEERITEERITEERITEERITEEQITEEQITEEQITEEQIVEEPTKKHPSYDSEIEWMSFGEAKEYIQSLDFETKEDFIEWLKSEDRPINFPPNPHQVYSEWISTEDFLFTKKEIYIPYSRAKVFAQSLGVDNPKDFFEIKRNEPDIFPEGFPSNPKIFYSKTGEWESWKDFLGF